MKKEFPISIKCFDVLNIPNKQVNIVHTFLSQEEYENWKNLNEKYDEKSDRYKVLDKVLPRYNNWTNVKMEIIENGIKTTVEQT